MAFFLFHSETTFLDGIERHRGNIREGNAFRNGSLVATPSLGLLIQRGPEKFAYHSTVASAIYRLINEHAY